MEKTIWLIYDGSCPICSPSAKALRIQESQGKLELINARSAHPLVTEIKERGLNLDEGIVVKYNNQYYHGADALHFLALIGTTSDWFNRMNIMLFRNKIMARISYPFFRTVRNLVLKLKGIRKISP